MVNTGIEWIGNIPDNWNLIQLKYASKEINEKNNPIKMQNVLSLTNTLGVVPYEEKGNKGNVSKDDLSQYKLAYKNTIIINSMNLKIGSVGLSNYDGCVSPVYYVLANNELSDIRFLNYIFQSDFQKYLGKFGKGIMEIREKISMYDVLHSYIPLPNLSIQKRISSYLDDKCNKINRIIEDNKKSIELLEEYKINHIDKLVTSGIYETQEEKNSNLKYLPKIPKKWNCTKIGNIISIPVLDGPHESPELFSEGVPYISADAIVNGKIDFERMRGYISKDYSEMCNKRYKPQKNDILVVKLGASTGKIGIVEDNTNFNIWVPLAVVRCKKEYNPKFVFYSMNSTYFQKQIKFGMTFGTQETLGVKTLQNLKIILPPMCEQEEIVEKLEKFIIKIDKVIKYRKKIIDNLEDYKRSLINEVVTGKKEV